MLLIHQPHANEAHSLATPTLGFTLHHSNNTLNMGKLRRLEIYTNTTLFSEDKLVPATSDEKLAASALLTLLSSPSPSGARQREGFGGSPALKRQKNDASLQRRPAERAAVERPVIKNESAQIVPDDRNIASVVASAMGGEADAEKLAEASKWVYRRVELVRGKYKGRTAVVVGMTAKKYRVRVEGVEHQLEVTLFLRVPMLMQHPVFLLLVVDSRSLFAHTQFYPSMFKNPAPVQGNALSGLQATNQVHGVPFRHARFLSLVATRVEHCVA